MGGTLVSIATSIATLGRVVGGGMGRQAFAVVLGGLLTGPAQAIPSVRGQVVAPDGKPVVEARIESADGTESTLTDELGRFALDEAVPPLALRITHPGFEETTIQVSHPPAGPLEVRLARRTFTEELQVAAPRAGDSFSPRSLASTPVHPQEAPAFPSNLTDALVQVAGVSENGQGGRLQVFSIRGISRHRVLSLISGARLVGERRAGVATAFVDPLLVGEIDVLRGPASTHFGSGALGGAIRIDPKVFDAPWAFTGYDSQGGENVLAAGWGNRGWSLGVVRRQAGDSESPAGAPLNDGFEQVTATLEKTWHHGSYTSKLLLLPSYGVDIGKANTDFPRRTTRYPYERHLLARFGLDSGRTWRLHAYVHPRSLETRVDEASEPTQLVASESFDFGAHWERTLGKSVRLGVDYFGRRGVASREFARTADGEAGPVIRSLDDAQEDEAAAFAVWGSSWGPVRLEGGGRVTWIRQANSGRESREQSVLTGFLGASLPLTEGLDLVANVGTGHRFPTLSEQFFTGTTGRGSVVGTPSLTPETAWNAELGLRRVGRRLFLRGALFRNRIEDYIDRIEVTPDVLTFRNLTSGTIEGIDLEALVRVRSGLSLGLSGHSLLGRDSSDRPLADIPPDEARLEVRFAPRRLSLASEVRWRQGKDDPASGEKGIPEAFLFAASLRYDLGQGLELVVSGSNLLDEAYFPSADRKAPLAPGRSVGLGIGWRVK